MKILLITLILGLVGCSPSLCQKYDVGDRVKILGTDLIGEVRGIDCTPFRCKYSIKPDALQGTRYLLILDQGALMAYHE